eukprot:1564544-Prymnesium_polylepis.1
MRRALAPRRAQAQRTDASLERSNTALSPPAVVAGGQTEATSGRFSTVRSFPSQPQFFFR